MSEFAEGYSPNTSLRMQALLHTTEVETCLSGASQTEEEAKAALDAVRRPAPFESRRGDDEATKAAHRRERNREHAVASRKRKRERIERLEQENTELRQLELDVTRERDDLAARVVAAERENEDLRARVRAMPGPHPPGAAQPALSRA